ncbi:hypothetical protein QVN42_06280 [Yersinia nurmii]|uniref:Uncharacterized protein n=1 Tax=Yersinia nurmii TaxID=685706 RepID=A0AAW7JX26_9GAMM|nr:hypothetical protein [Yersinia nurmii]MDN0087006.1 hypothetical protein [Yersinia nurmii]CNE16344.1 Uncharacterised protein [Yersinia nurmii]
MKNTKKYEKSLLAIMLFTAVLYLLAPPALIAYFFGLYNLNPFSIGNLPYFNPFSTGRGLPLHQIYWYLLLAWLFLNGLIVLVINLIYLVFFRSNDDE